MGLPRGHGGPPGGDSVLVPLSSGTFLLFSLLFPRRSPLLNRRWKFLVPYIPAAAMVALLLWAVPLEVVLVAMAPEPGMSRFAYRLEGSFVPVFLGVAAVPSLIALGVWVRAHLRSGSPRERGVLRTLIFGIGVLILFATATALARAYAGLTLPIDENEVAVVSAALIGYAVLRYRILIEPVAEERKPGEAAYDLAPGSSFLTQEPRPDLGFRVFADLVTHGSEGLALTRTSPREVRSTHGLSKTPLVWVGRVAPEEGTRAVDHPEEMLILVSNFLEHATNGVVMLDAAEYLVQRHGPSLTLQTLYNMREIVARHGGRLIVSVNPKSVEPGELALLQKELKPLGVEGAGKSR